MVDPISDLLTQIRNAYLARHKVVELPLSKQKQALAKVLKDVGFLTEVTSKGEGIKKTLVLELRYLGKLTALTGLKRLSTPGRRLYWGVSDLQKIKSRQRTIILSTSKGLMTGTQAKKENIGGELVCEVW